VARACRCGALVAIGGDIATAGPPPREGWRIHVTDDHRARPDAPGQTVAIASGGLATSSTATRRWRHGSATMHHIIDPATGAPAVGRWRTVSVAAATCTDANIASTAALVRGDAAAAGWLERCGLPARLVDHRGGALHVGEWPLAESAARAREALTKPPAPRDSARAPRHTGLGAAA
jgi:thiamine biosynthesis lipoprotein